MLGTHAVTAWLSRVAATEVESMRSGVTGWLNGVVYERRREGRWTHFVAPQRLV